MNTKELADTVLAAMQSMVGKHVTPISDTLNALTKRVDEWPVPKDGKDGAPGERGADGKSFTVEEVRAMVDAAVAEAVAAIPVPKDGAPGRDGIDGKDGAPGEPGRDGIDGKSVTVEDVQPIIAEAVAAIPVPKDGAPGRDGIDGKDGAPGERGADGTDGRDGLEGKAGAPGRDAAQLEILAAIDETRSYPRGTYAKHAGGLWRAFETTDAMKGWECWVEGVAGVEYVQSADDPRVVTASVRMSSGKSHDFVLKNPSMIYRGIFKEGSEYDPGDVVTWGGSLWHCNEGTKDKPADGSKSWQLAAKRGRDGKDGVNGKDFTKGVPL